MKNGTVCLISLLALVALFPLTGTFADNRPVEIIADARVTRAGDEIPFLLFIPNPDMDVERAPFPGLILTHGFARDYGRHIDNAMAFARAGMVVMIPNLTGPGQTLIVGRRQVDNTADHFKWLRFRANDPSDPLFGILDPERIALAGHSAGGAISLEAAVSLQRSGVGPAALVLLDAVPYSRTLFAARSLQEVALLSLRSEPGTCNAQGAIEKIEKRLDFQFESVLIAGATHCDAEAPTDIACQLLCGGESPEASEAYRQRARQFLQRIFELSQ